MQKSHLTDQWVRQPGLSLAIHRIRSLRDLPQAEQFLAAVLRLDNVRALELFETCTPSTLLQRVNQVARNEALSGILFEHLSELNLVKKLREHSSQDVRDVITYIVETSRQQAVSFRELESKFASTVNLLRPFLSDLLWLKGAHISRALYRPPSLRHYSDLDILVRMNRAPELIAYLGCHDYETFDSPAYTNQIGNGPVETSSDLLIAPDTEWAPTSFATLAKEMCLCIDMKVAPFQHGLQAVEIERIFSDATEHTVFGVSYKAPSAVDHLMMLLTNFESDRFEKWRALYDIHQLVKTLNATQWDSLIERSQIEGLSYTIWIGLLIAKDRLDSSIPDRVLNTLAPPKRIVNDFFRFVTNPAFVWNSTSLPMLILNLFFSEDQARKKAVLLRSINPSQTFLHRYYGPGLRVSLLLKHWYVLALPGGAVRNTMGKHWFQRNIGFNRHAGSAVPTD